MPIYWGDIHNHCAITYGFGSQKNALLRAAEQLDFCAITGHAMWQDIYESNKDTKFIVDFHQIGFKKLFDNWEQVRQEIADGNSDKLVTFQAYEMHSSQYGDHHIVSPSDNLPLIYRSSPKELKSDVGVPSITVAHHIGYTPGYRGINWDLFDESVTPLVEVCSKHGCAMSETAPFPYYHDMGPRDSRNTVYEGLKRGCHFGFVGSTDHHAGYPGSYGDGQAAVIAKSKTREAIFEALSNRHTYAVTGDKILCGFRVNDAIMGSIIPLCQKRLIEWEAELCYPLNKVVIYKNLKPLKVINGEEFETSLNDRKFKLRVEMGWGNNTEELFEWKGQLGVEKGEISQVTPCFKGRSILSPTDSEASGNDSVNDIDNRILEGSKSACSWQCYTLKNTSTLHPQTCAMIFEISGDKNTQIAIDINGHKATHTIEELCKYGYSEHMQPWHSQAFKVHKAISESEYKISGSICDEDFKPAFYHMEVFQKNNHCAFITPVWVE